MTQAVARRAANQARVGVAKKPAAMAEARVPCHPRIASLAAAYPSYSRDQREMLAFALEHVPSISSVANQAHAEKDSAEIARKVEHIFCASGVRRRSAVIDIDEFYSRPRSTGERMAAYRNLASVLGRAAVEHCLAGVGGTDGEQVANEITDFVVTSCTGYSAPGIDIQLAHELAMRGDIRRVVVGHMGCAAGIVGLRQGLAAARANPGAKVLQLSIELCSLHFSPSVFAAPLDVEQLTCMSLFGDAAAALVLTGEPAATGPEVVDAYCSADFTTANQLTWTISDQGFMMGLSPRVPVTLRRNVRGAVERLLAPHDLDISDVAHWMVHPGGPSILDVVQEKLNLSDEQMEDSRAVLAEHGNCSSATILLILERLVRSGRAKTGDWAVMMAFGPGLTIETCLLRF